MDRQQNDPEKVHTINITHLQQYVRYLETIQAQALKDEVEIDEKFQAVKCYRNIFGTATAFKFVNGFAFLKRNFNGVIHPLNGIRSQTLFVRRSTQPTTLAICMGDKNAAEFVTYVNGQDNVTVFSPEVQEPIGRIVRRKAERIIDDESDIDCCATKMKFTMKNFQSDAGSSNVPAMKVRKTRCAESLKILSDAFNEMHQRTPSMSGTLSRVLELASLAVDYDHFCLECAESASVNRMITTTRNGSSTIDLKEFVFQIDDNISEPTKVMFLVAFSNWVMWSKYEANGRGTPWTTIFVMLFFVIIIAVAVYSNI